MNKTEKSTNKKGKVVVENYYKTTDKEAQKMLFNEQYARMIIINACDIYKVQKI